MHNISIVRQTAGRETAPEPEPVPDYSCTCSQGRKTQRKTTAMRLAGGRGVYASAQRRECQQQLTLQGEAKDAEPSAQNNAQNGHERRQTSCCHTHTLMHTHTLVCHLMNFLLALSRLPSDKMQFQPGRACLTSAWPNCLPLLPCPSHRPTYCL